MNEIKLREITFEQYNSVYEEEQIWTRSIDSLSATKGVDEIIYYPNRGVAVIDNNKVVQEGRILDMFKKNEEQ